MTMFISKQFVYLLLVCLFLFIFATNSFAASSVFFDTPIPTGANIVSATLCERAVTCANTDQNSTSSAACGANGCGGGLSWTKYSLTCAKVITNPATGAFKYEAYYNPSTERVYSIGDKCISGETGLRPGYCDGTPGGLYKKCCSGSTEVACVSAASTYQDGIDPNEGACPSGSTETAPGVTSCRSAGPTCSDGEKNGDEEGVDCGGSCRACSATCGTTCIYSQDGACYSGNCPVGATSCGFNNNCSYVAGCSSGSQVVCPADPPPPSTPPASSSCNATITFSSNNPVANSNVIVNVTGNSSNVGWNNVVYRVDNGSWSSNVPVVSTNPPGYRFNINSGTPGNHSVQFAVNNGNVVCGGSGSFTTQAVAPDCNANALEMSVSANPVNVGNGITFNLHNTDRYQGSTHVEDYWEPTGGVNCSGAISWSSSSDGSKTCTAIAGGNFRWTHKWKNIVPGNPNITSDQCQKTLNFTVNTPDTQRPTCNTFTISRTSGVMGRDHPTFSVSADDNVQVRTVEIRYAGTSSVVSRNDNGLGTKPTYSLTDIPLTTTNLSPGLYTFNVLVTDTSGNINNIEDMNSCTVTYRNDPPPWYPASCDANQVFSGCKMQGGNDCSDWGVAGDPPTETWRQCQTACDRPVNERNNYCRQVVGTISTPANVDKTGTNWNNMAITFNVRNSDTATGGEGADVALLEDCVPGTDCTCSFGGSCTVNKNWTFLTECRSTANGNSTCNYPPPNTIQPGTSRTFALFTKNHNTILSASNTRFNSVCLEGSTRVKTCTGVATIANACTL